MTAWGMLGVGVIGWELSEQRHKVYLWERTCRCGIVWGGGAHVWGREVGWSCCRGCCHRHRVRRLECLHDACHSVATARLTADPQAEVSCFSDSAGWADPVKKLAVLAVDSTQATTQSRPSRPSISACPQQPSTKRMSLLPPTHAVPSPSIPPNLSSVGAARQTPETAPP